MAAFRIPSLSFNSLVITCLKVDLLKKNLLSSLSFWDVWINVFHQIW